jgi:hypothetical protein
MEYYNLKEYTNSDIQPLILAINMIGENLTGLELGVYQAESFLTILHNCSIKKLYGVDSWKPYCDYLKLVPDEKPHYCVDEKTCELNKVIAYNHIKYSIDNEKIHMIEEDSLIAVNKIENESLDFIFFDAMMTKEQTYREAKAYYPKIKKGGYFMGHDSKCTEQVIEPIKEIMKLNNNTNRLIIYNKCFMFKC